VFFLMIVSGNDGDAGPAIHSPKRRNSQQTDRPTTDYQHGIALAGRNAQDTVQGTGEGFDQHRCLIVQIIGYAEHLRSMSDERFSETAAGIATVSGLDSCGDVAMSHVSAESVPALCARLAWCVDAARPATQGRVQHDAITH
jgi:hypothetical protein